MAKTTKKTAKTAPKKATAKKTAPAKRTTAKKTTATTKAKATTATLRIPAVKQASTRRPSQNAVIPQSVLDSVSADIEHIKITLEEYATHLRALDRKRLNGVGIKKLGFIQEAYDMAMANPEYLPHYLTTEKFTEDHQLFLTLRSIHEQTGQILELEWNMVVTAADMDYTDALEFYAPVKDAAHRRIDAAETLYKTLEIYFKHKKSKDKPETEKELLKDIKGYIHGTKDGKAVIENISPKTTGGVHKVIDEKFQDTVKFKETEEGEIEE